MVLNAYDDLTTLRVHDRHTSGKVFSDVFLDSSLDLGACALTTSVFGCVCLCVLGLLAQVIEYKLLLCLGVIERIAVNLAVVRDERLGLGPRDNYRNKCVLVVLGKRRPTVLAQQVVVFKDHSHII